MIACSALTKAKALLRISHRKILEFLINSLVIAEAR